MIFQAITGAGFGIFAGYSVAMCGGVLSLLVLFCGCLAGYLLNLRLKGYPAARVLAATVLIAVRSALFIYPVPELLPLVCGMICGMTFYFRAGNRSSLCCAAIAGMISCSLFLLFVSGSGEAAAAFICGGSALITEFFKRNTNRKAAVFATALLLVSLFPAGSASKIERMISTSNFLKFSKAANVSACLPGSGVATKVLCVGEFSENAAELFSNFPGMKKVDSVKSYFGLYPVIKPNEKRESYHLVMVNGNGRMCRLASNLVAKDGVLVVPEKHVSELPAAFRHWSELPFAPGFIVLARDFAVDCQSASLERKMQHHLSRCGLKDTVPQGVFDAVFDTGNKPVCGIRNTDTAKRINYTLWFFGLVSGVYLILRLVVFSRFDKGERRWSALENTASAMLLLLLLKRSPDTIATALLPAAAFFMLPILQLTGAKWRILQLAGAALCILSIFLPEFINASQLVGAVCCCTMWNRLRQEKGAVMVWVDSCSLAGFIFGTAIFSLLLTVNAPAVFIIGLVLLLRSNALFRMA